MYAFCCYVPSASWSLALQTSQVVLDNSQPHDLFRRNPNQDKKEEWWPACMVWHVTAGVYVPTWLVTFRLFGDLSGLSSNINFEFVTKGLATRGLQLCNVFKIHKVCQQHILFVRIHTFVRFWKLVIYINVVMHARTHTRLLLSILHLTLSSPDSRRLIELSSAALES